MISEMKDLQTEQCCVMWYS